MINLSRATFAIGSVAFVFIGLMHSFVHLTELSGADLGARFQRVGPIDLQGGQVLAWDLFQGMSLVMGFFSCVLGVVLLGAILGTPRDQVPHWAIGGAACLVQAGIAVVGAHCLSSFQVIGGGMGIICFGVPILARPWPR